MVYPLEKAQLATETMKLPLVARYYVLVQQLPSAKQAQQRNHVVHSGVYQLRLDQFAMPLSGRFNPLGFQGLPDGIEHFVVRHRLSCSIGPDTNENALSGFALAARLAEGMWVPKGDDRCPSIYGRRRTSKKFHKC
jgi:hypothetical protein